jgi:hypothetical protein
LRGPETWTIRYSNDKQFCNEANLKYQVLYVCQCTKHASNFLHRKALGTIDCKTCILFGLPSNILSQIIFTWLSRSGLDCSCQNPNAWPERLKTQTSGVANLDNWGGGGNIHIFVFCIINFFWNQLFLRSVNTNIWILPPSPIIEFATPLIQTCTFLKL